MAFTDILNYKIIRLIGSGGMGSVYLAANVNIDQQVAIKVIRPEYAKNPEIRARFKKEAEFLCSLDHPGIVKFLNYVETDNGLFLIMEYVKGITLKDFIEKKNGLIVESKAYSMLNEILDAFSYAHKKGVIHRDIKPSNIIITEDGHAKIMDFGIAGIVSGEESGNDNFAGGTPAYMSPEQIYGRHLDPRSDIYSLGVLIFNMLSGKAPYDSTKLTDFAIKSKVVKEELPRMKEFYPYISDKMQDVVDKATEKDPDKRYQNCSELRADVKKAIAPDRLSPGMKYGLIAFAVLLLIGVFLIWDYNRTKIEYYADYVEVFGIPKGIHRLSKNEVGHRDASYRFEKSKGKVRRVSHINSAGNLIRHSDSEFKDKIIDMTMTYVEGSDKVDTQTFRNQSGRVLYVKDYDSNMKTCTFKLNDEFGTEMTLNSQVDIFQSSFDNNLEGKSKISKYILHFSDDGLLKRMEYAGFGNIRVSDGQGIFGKSYVYDKKGRIIEETYLGKDGKPKSTKFGLAKKKFSFDRDDNLVKIEYLTADGKPSSDGNNCPVVNIDYDKWGNRIMERYYTFDGKPTLRTDDQVAGYSYEYDDKGHKVKITCIGIDGGQTYSFGYAGVLYEYDDNGYRSAISHIDTKGNAAINTSEDISYFRAEIKNDKYGNPLEYSFLNIDGKPIETIYSPVIKITYDDEGKETSRYFCNPQGQPIIAPASGYAGYVMEYNDQGRVSKLTYKSADKKNLVVPVSLICEKRWEYDARGNIISISYFDDKGKPVADNEGISSYRMEYDDNGNEISRSFFDASGKPVIGSGYCAILEYQYDDQGNLSAYRYKGVDGKPMMVKGEAGRMNSFDARGNLTSTYPLGLDGKMLSGATEIRNKYDERDNVTERAYYNAAGNPTNDENGIHREVSKYDNLNHLIRSETYDTNGKLKNSKGVNAAIRINEYDDRGNLITSTFFDASGKRGSDNLNVHKYYNEYDKIVNKITHQISFGIDGKPIIANGVAPEGRIEYDKRGNLTRLMCYDGYGKKINCGKGWAEQRFEYDDTGDKISEAYFDLDGKPKTDPDNGWHKCVYKYNPRRLVESISYLGNSNQPVNASNGIASIRYKYNDQNQKTEVSFRSADGKPAEINGVYYRETYQYKNGAPYKSEIFDKSNRKIAVGTYINNNWNYQPVGGGTAPNMSNRYSDWRSEWRDAAAQCPVKLNDVITIRSIRISDDSITVVFVYDFNNMIEQTDSELEEVVKEFTRMLRTQTATPSSVEIYVEIYDTNGNRKH
ncbi:MAG: serine/threonine protein kinase [Muribaculaceae bacterium]|nr:serine/threonine protein kinase [Muribaculaceae bacterium]